MRRSQLLPPLLGLLLAALSCTSPATHARPVVVVIQDGSVPDARQVISPAVLALEAFLGERGVAIDVRDTGGLGGAAIAIAERAADDPRVVAVVVAPFAWLPPQARDRLLDAGLAVVSLSSIDTPAPGRGPWRRLVPTVEQEAVAMLQTLPGERPCVAGEDTVVSRRLTDEIRRRGGPELRFVGSPPEAAGEQAAREGCTGLAWTGSAPGAVVLRDALLRTEADVAIVLGPAARTDAYVDAGWPAAEGTVGVCGCVDLSTSADASSQAFVHSYQAATGLDPGPYAAEGADAARLILGEVGADAPTRAGVAVRVGATRSLVGVASIYAWSPDGELDPANLRTFRVTGVRWIQAA